MSPHPTILDNSLIWKFISSLLNNCQILFSLEKSYKGQVAEFSHAYAGCVLKEFQVFASKKKIIGIIFVWMRQ